MDQDFNRQTSSINRIERPVWPDAEIKSSPICPKATQKCSHCSLHLKNDVFKIAQKVLYIWADFVRNFFTRNFQKSSKLVTLVKWPKQMKRPYSNCLCQNVSSPPPSKNASKEWKNSQCSGRVGIATSDSWDPRFESSRRLNLHVPISIWIEKSKIKKKRDREWPILFKNVIPRAFFELCHTHTHNRLRIRAKNENELKH